MSELTIYTRAYHKELKDIPSKNTIINEGEEGGLFFIKYEFNDFDTTGFIELLKRIIISENQAVRSSHKIEEHIINCVFPDSDHKLERELEVFIRENSILNLEGYARFRMWEYTHYFNIVLYSIVKRLYN